MDKIYSFSRLLITALLVTVALSAGFSNPARPKAAPTPKPAATVDDLVALLPPSDAVMVLNMNRIMNELVPQLKALSPDSAVKMEKELNEFIAQTGIDPTRIHGAVIGFTMSGNTASGAAILDGLSFDITRLGAVLQDKKSEVRMEEYKGKSLYIVASKELQKAGSEAGVTVEDDMAFTQLSDSRVAIGSLSGIKGVVDGGGGTANAALATLLNSTGNGILRFAANIPESAKGKIDEQGDLFKSFSTIRTIFGSLDMGNDLSTTIDAKMRTATADEASQLHTSLAGLVGMGKMLLSGNKEPQMKVFTDLLDQIRLGAQDTDVSLNLTISRQLIDMISESAKPAAKPQAKPASKTTTKTTRKAAK